MRFYCVNIITKNQSHVTDKEGLHELKKIFKTVHMCLVQDMYKFFAEIQYVTQKKMNKVWVLVAKQGSCGRLTKDSNVLARYPLSLKPYL